MVDDVATFESHRQHGFFKGWPTPAELSHVIAGKERSGQANNRVICVNLGLGIYDVVVARKLFEVARHHGIGTELPL
jgi:ornithine cyclodeaminase/alanine dehydrogenase-like protein (mu-crystallin family)